MLTHQSLRSYTFRKQVFLRPFHLLVEKLLGEEATGPGTFYVERHDILKRALPPGASLLECGSGAGQMISYFTEAVGCRYVGSDISYGMVRDATRRHPHLAFLQADALHLPFKDGSFDAVLAVMVLHHVEPASRGQLIEEMRRVAERAVFVQDLRSFDHPVLRAAYRLYYSLADGSYWRPTLSQWLKSFEPLPVTFTTTPERNVSQRTCFFALPGLSR